MCGYELMQLEHELRKIKDKHFADYFGIANLTSATEFICSQGGSELKKYPTAITMGIALFDDIVDLLPKRDSRAVCVAYKHHCYDVINNRLDFIISEMSSFLNNQGFHVYPVPASKRVNDDDIHAVFSHKLAAHLSGLGWIGKSCLLVTPDNGPRVRFASLLTNAPLSLTGSPIEDGCGDCTECVEICPVQAFTGKPFNDDEPREVRYNAKKCENYFSYIQEENDWAFCGMCVYVCPYGREQNNKKALV